ncbi:MAG: DUF1573 domain-containing protein [Flavobacteriia bacterium]|jgi:hypothetical protein|nr:DUF1573 domain-containing protein [Flavobacteriia bacterium]
MKKIFFTMMLAFVASVGFNAAIAQEVQAGPKIEFAKDVHDYGNVKNGGNGTCTFEFTNTGSEPLIISNAKGSCGCTVPEWPKEPIAPGEKQKITVKYNTKNAGPINKSVTITSNAVNEPTKVLRIKGNVAAPAEGSPVNNTGAPSAN